MHLVVYNYIVMSFGTSLLLVLHFPLTPFKFGRDFIDSLYWRTFWTWYTCHSWTGSRVLPQSGSEAEARMEVTSRSDCLLVASRGESVDVA